MPHGETSSSATRIAVQLRPQQKLSATSRSLAIVALLMAGLGATGHLADEGDGSRGWVFYRARGARRHPNAHDWHAGLQATSFRPTMPATVNPKAPPNCIGALRCASIRSTC